MNKLKAIILILTFAIAFGMTSGAQTRVLIIGNSQTGVYDKSSGKAIYNLAGMLNDMSKSAPSGHPGLEVTLKNVGGASLKKHWDMGDAQGTPRNMIISDKWDYVVIQEIYNAKQQEFETYASLFNDLIRKCGAKTILFATAGVTNYYSHASLPYPEEFKKLNSIQIDFGKKNGIMVAPAGYAWMKYLGSHPSEGQLLDLYHKDKGHPGYKGSYIYACTLFAAITGKNPKGLTSEFRNLNASGLNNVISPEEASAMQKAAWKVYRRYRTGDYRIQ